MDRVPDSLAPTDLILWIARERDAAWAAKLAILRARRRDDIAHFGRCLREHERHADELAALARLVSPGCELPTEPAFVTRDASVVGAIDDWRVLLDAMDGIEAERIAWYERARDGQTRGSDDDRPAALLDGVIDRHLADARARLTALRCLRERRREAAA